MTCTSGTSYIVKAGDTLFLIAQQQLGDGNLWPEIKNPDGSSPNPNDLQVGQELCLPITPGPGGQVQEILDAHNNYRAEVGVPPLQWSDSLAASAQQWANYLASTGQFKHSGTNGVGENLAQGSPPGSWTVTQLVDIWGAEKQYFTEGIFPNVSSTGNWEDVGHYTQMVWRNTTQVGCGVATGNGNIVLVGQYTPPGNVNGESVY
jgi:Cysteine-rich secretory protein family/LysM domain